MSPAERVEAGFFLIQAISRIHKCNEVQLTSSSQNFKFHLVADSGSLHRVTQSTAKFLGQPPRARAVKDRNVLLCMTVCIHCMCISMCLSVSTYPSSWRSCGT